MTVQVNAVKQFFSSGSFCFIRQFGADFLVSNCMKPRSVTIQMKAVEQYSPVVLVI